MGFPLSRFQHLSALCRKESPALEEFSRFKFTAIVLHKPRDSRFRMVMRTNFEHLSGYTGDDFAFITFIDPPADWAEEHRSWMLTRETLMADSGNYSSTDFTEALCARLSIQNLPAIVLTDNLNSPRYAVLQTGSKAVVSQLERIGEFASGLQHSLPIDAEAVTDMLGSLGEYSIHETLDSEYLSTNIVDIMAAFSMDGSGASTVGDEFLDMMSSTFQRDSAKEHIREAMDRNKSRYEALRDAPATDPEEVDTAREVYSSYLAVVLSQEEAQRRAPEATVEWRTRSIGWSQYLMNKPKEFTYNIFFTKNSQRFYKTFKLLKSYFAGQLRSEFSDPDDEMEYSPVCIELCKIVEEELNASVVQLIRQHNGIPMPEFYREHCAARGKVVVANNLINLKDRRTGTLRQVPIGSVLCMLEALNQDADFAPFNTENFLSAVNSFKEYRNDTPHPIVLDREDFRQMDRMFDSLFREWMIPLYKLRQNLQGLETIDL